MFYQKRQSARRSKKLGDATEQAILAQLRSMGAIVEKLETGWRVRRVGKKIVSASPIRKVLTDIVGIFAGRAILCEVKARDDSQRFAYSELQKHQHAALADWSAAGAICLVAWVRNGTPVIFERSVVVMAGKWVPGKSLDWDDAVAMKWRP